MTRKDWEKIERILKEIKPYDEDNWTSGACPAPSAEWMRRKIAFAIADEFKITGEEQRNKFLTNIQEYIRW